MTIDEAIAAARQRLAAAGAGSPGLDARILAREAFGLDAAALILKGGDAVDAAAMQRFAAMVDRRAAGEPVGRILGRREFHGLTFVLSADTLEPRPDTETLVDLAVASVKAGAVPGSGPDGAGLRFADIGTGTGAIAVALAAALPAARGVATDISAGALATAAANAAEHGVADRIDFREGSYLAPLSGSFGLVLSNPPYIETAALAGLAREVRDHDPRAALDGGADGLEAYRAIAGGVAALLEPGGIVAVEIGSDQAAAVSALFSAAGLAEVAVHPDIEGRDRVVSGRRE